MAIESGVKRQPNEVYKPHPTKRVWSVEGHPMACFYTLTDAKEFAKLQIDRAKAIQDHAPEIFSALKEAEANLDLRTLWPEVYVWAKAQGMTGFLARFENAHNQIADALDKTGVR